MSDTKSVTGVVCVSISGIYNHDEALSIRHPEDENRTPACKAIGNFHGPDGLRLEFAFPDWEFARLCSEGKAVTITVHVEND
jgi:hypothetical protein